MGKITVTNQLSSLKTLFNKMDEIYYKSGGISIADTASEITADMEFPVLSDGVSFNTGEAETTEVKLTTGTTWTTRSEKGESDISFQVASISDKVNALFMDSKGDIASSTSFDETQKYKGKAYSLAPKKVTGALIMFSDDKQAIIILPMVEMYASLVVADGESPAYFNVTVKPVENADGSDIFILEKTEE